MIWNEKHAPKTLDEVSGNLSAVEEIKRWAIDWERGRNGKPLLLYGPPGVGKSAAATALVSEMGWDSVEMNASSLRNKKSIERVLGAASNSGSLFGSRKLLLLEEVDALYGRKDRGGTGAITKIVKESSQPAILTAADYWNPKLLYLRRLVTPVEFKRVNSRGLANTLAAIAEKEGVSVNKSVLEKIAENNQGDIRSAVNDFQALAQGKKELFGSDLSAISHRDREKSAWEAMKLLMKTNSYDEAVRLSWDSDVDPDMFMKWVEENVPLEYTEAGDLERAFECLSRADVFRGRIFARQHWGFLRYVNVLMTAGVALSKKKAYAKFVKYSFPGIIRKLGSTKIKRARLKKLGKKVGLKCHCSIKRANSLFIPLLDVLLRDKQYRPLAIDYFELEPDDVAFVLGRSVKQVEKYFKK